MARLQISTENHMANYTYKKKGVGIDLLKKQQNLLDSPSVTQKELSQFACKLYETKICFSCLSGHI